MSNLENILKDGGKVLIVGGYNKSFSEYRKHPQFEFWTGDDKYEVGKHIQNKQFPPNARALILSRFVSHPYSTIVSTEARKRGVTIFAPLSDGQIRTMLNEMLRGVQKVIEHKELTHKDSEPVETYVMKHKEQFTNTPQLTLTPELQEQVTKSEVTKETESVTKPTMHDFIHSNNFDPNATGELDRLYKLYTSKGWKTTRGSMGQAITAYRKKHSLPAAPRKGSADMAKVRAARGKNPVSEAKKNLLDLVDEAITAMKLVREEVKKLDSQSADYIRLKEKISALLS